MPAADSEPARTFTWADTTILVVEDDPEVRETVVGLLSALGINVVEAENGVAAVAVLEGNRQIDILFTDVVLPGGMSGPDIAIEARRKYPGLKVIFSSGYPDGEVDKFAAVAERPWFIRKPYRKSELAELLDGVIQS